MINFIWFTRTETLYAELDALFYFFITTCTWQEHGSGCGATPGGPAFPGFLFIPKKFHISPKPMWFVISRTSERVFFNIYFSCVSVFFLK